MQGEDNGDYVARVLSGGDEHCAFCAALASLGFIHQDEAPPEFWKFHNGCGCIMVSAPDPNTTIEGQDYSKYREAYDACKVDGDLKATLKAIRENYPELFRDGRASADGWLKALPRLDRADTYSEASYWANQGAARLANGRYRPTPYVSNCHQVVSAMEMRARGYGVTANPTINDMGRRASAIAADWIDRKTGKTPEFTYAPKNARSYAKFLREATSHWPDGARGFAAGSWVGRNSDGHVFNIEKVNGKIRIVEGQIPGQSNHFANMRPSTLGVLRVDNLDPSPLLRDKVTAAAPPITKAQQIAYAKNRIALIDRHLNASFLSPRAAQALQWEKTEVMAQLKRLGVG